MPIMSPTLLLLLAFPMATGAFSSIAAIPSDFGRLSGDAVAPPAAAMAQESASWRITLDIGREPLSNMPFDWARSGCRMPLVVPCDFERTSDGQENGKLYPRVDTISFTGPGGAVVAPIGGGDWWMTTNKDIGQELSFSLTVPEMLERRDVIIEGGTTLALTGYVYSQAELDRLNEEYYQAREATWEVGEELNDMANRQGAAKKWNQEKGRWEKRYPTENFFSMTQKQIDYWGAKAKQQQKQNQRPDPNSLSVRGSFPGVEKGLYIAKGGVVRAGERGPVMGTWYAQPITDQPASYRN